MILLLGLCITATAFAVEHVECDDCEELAKPVDPSEEMGACCFGRSCLDSGVTRAQCRGTWAGAGTSCEDCEAIRPCCNPFTGQCSLKFCADCADEYGVPVAACEFCEITQTLPPDTTKPTAKTTAPATQAPTPHATEPPIPHGACCVPDGTCSELTQAECHACDGVFRGDYTECGADENNDGFPDSGVCKRRCCMGTIECAITNNKAECDALSGRIGAFSTECTDEVDVCGVSCCTGVRCLIASSVAECEACGGKPNAEQECAEMDCGGACCSGSTCNAFNSEAECEHSGGVYSQGEQCTPSLCGGACCDRDAGQCREVASEQCDVSDGVYQGDGTQCDENDGICLNDGACCVDGTCTWSANAADCFAKGGVFRGEGSSCADDSIDCESGACCTGKGCLSARDVHTCRKKDGAWAGLGSTCDMPAICDTEAGACCCGDECREVCSEQQCRALCGSSWLGAGSTCETEVCADPPQGEGACCVQKSYMHDGALCSIETEDECIFHGGAFQGVATSCGLQGLSGERTCKIVRGACCVPTAEMCHDSMTITECRNYGGHFAGGDVSCSDEYVCQPRHKGACCKPGWPCKELSHVACLRDGGRFQGFESTCNDNDGAVCAVCLPCEVNRPHQSGDCTEDADCPSGTICLARYGTCVVEAIRIASQYGKPIDWEPAVDFILPAGDPWLDTEAGKKWTRTAARLEIVDKSETSDTENNQGNDDDDDGDDDDDHQHSGDDDDAYSPIPIVGENLGPLSCGSADTIGYPCVVHPSPTKCGIGVCMAPPEGNTLTDSCVSVCRQVREYECGCCCEDAWLKSCASIAGHIVLDANNDAVRTETDGGVVGAIVQLYQYVDGAYTFVSEEITKYGGHYAFGGIEGGDYKVKVELPGGVHFGGDGKSYRKVSVECLEEDEQRKRSVGQVAWQRVNKANHLAEDIDFFVLPGDPPSGSSGETDDDDDDDDDDAGSDSGASSGAGTGGLSGATVALIVILVVVVVACCALVLIVCCCCGKRKKKSRKSRY